MVATLAGYGLFTVMPQVSSRLWLAATIIGFGLLIMLAGACASSVVWGKLLKFIDHQRAKNNGFI
ncbi:MAG: hypothetical protein ABIJ10_02280 [Candidatus Micrarchaeota archaeon]